MRMGQVARLLRCDSSVKVIKGVIKVIIEGNIKVCLHYFVTEPQILVYITPSSYAAQLQNKYQYFCSRLR